MSEKPICEICGKEVRVKLTTTPEMGKKFFKQGQIFCINCLLEEVEKKMPGASLKIGI